MTQTIKTLNLIKKNFKFLKSRKKMRSLRGTGHYDKNLKSYLFSRNVKKSLVKRLVVDSLSPKEHFNGKKIQEK